MKTDSRGKIDLHMHTTVSDGTDAPEELLMRVRAAGIALFSVTDHDAIKGSARLAALLSAGSFTGRAASVSEEACGGAPAVHEANTGDCSAAANGSKARGWVPAVHAANTGDCSAAAKESEACGGDPAFITGVEFSCKDEEGKYHILGYGYDPEAAAIRDVVDLGHACRLQKVEARLAFLRESFGFTFPEEDLRALFSMDNPGKPHIGHLLVKNGYARTKDQAITDYINRLHYRGRYVRPEEAVRGILDSGGIPVLAHPSFGDGGQRIVGEEMDARLRRLMGYGLRGVEAFYSGFTEELRREVLSFAEKYGLYVTAGSDYHGTNKTVRLGDTGLGEPAEWPEGLRRFLEDVQYIGNGRDPLFVGT